MLIFVTAVLNTRAQSSIETEIETSMNSGIAANWRLGAKLRALTFGLLPTDATAARKCARKTYRLTVLVSSESITKIFITFMPKKKSISWIIDQNKMISTMSWKFQRRCKFVSNLKNFRSVPVFARRFSSQGWFPSLKRVEPHFVWRFER